MLFSVALANPGVASAQFVSSSTETPATTEIPANLTREQVRDLVAWGVLKRMFTASDRLHALPGSIWRQITDNGRIIGCYLLFQLIGLLIAGWIAERLAKRLLEKKLSQPVAVPSLGKKFDLACSGAEYRQRYPDGNQARSGILWG